MLWNPRTDAREVRRVLREDGRLVIAVHEWILGGESGGVPRMTTAVLAWTLPLRRRCFTQSVEEAFDGGGQAARLRGTGRVVASGPRKPLPTAIRMAPKPNTIAAAVISQPTNGMCESRVSTTTPASSCQTRCTRLAARR